MKVLGFMPLHYGKEYLREAILSIAPHIDTMLILYTSKPSYGHRSEAECPETEQELKGIVESIPGVSVRWVNVTDLCGNEGSHRDMAVTYAAEYGFDVIASIDADEVWDTDKFNEALGKVLESDGRYIRVSNWVNLWRSFNHACYDWFEPVRFVNMTQPGGQASKAIEGRIYHFGYAQSDEIMKYKWSIHGHQNELRPNWIEEKYFGWKEGDKGVHPVAINLWNPEPFDKTTLPEILHTHPNYNKEIIE